MFSHSMPLSPAQSGRIAACCSAMVLAGEVHLTKIARFLQGVTQQDSRVRWLQRSLEAAFMSQERVYQPVLKHTLRTFRDECWHLVMDRTTLWDGQVDLATIALKFRKRAIPLVWRCVPFGAAGVLPTALYPNRSLYPSGLLSCHLLAAECPRETVGTATLGNRTVLSRLQIVGLAHYPLATEV